MVTFKGLLKEEEYMDCPTNYRFNCKYADIHCYKCRGTGNSPDLLYSPLNNNLPIETHPTYINEAPNKLKAKLKGRKANKQGRKAEERVNTTLGAKHNKTSWGWDGLLEKLSLRLEIKCRLKGTSPQWPTKEEWSKAQATGIDIFIVTSPEGDKTARVCMSLDTLKVLLQDIDK